MRDPQGLQKTAMAITRWIGSPTSIIWHTALFLGSFAFAYLGFIEFDRMLLVLTTIVSLEAIYLAIFIQMTINFQSAVIAEVEHDIDEIQEDVEDISEDIDELQEDVEELSEEEDAEEAAEKARQTQQKQTLNDIHMALHRLLDDVERLKNNRASDDTKPLL